MRKLKPVFEKIAETGILGATSEEVIQHILRQWLWENSEKLKKLGVDLTET